MAHDPSSCTYGSLLQQLGHLSEKAKKLRPRHSSSHPIASDPASGDGSLSHYRANPLYQVIQDAHNLIFQLKRHTMHSDSASARVLEAQTWMQRASIEKSAGLHEDEAAAYLNASALWLSVEQERKDINMLSNGDALGRAVLCCAMACNVLLTQRPNIATSPLPIKLTRMPNPHVSKCWSVCMKLADRLAQFGCLEMATDYYELAAVIVTTDSPPAAAKDTAVVSDQQASTPPPAQQAASFSVPDSVNAPAGSALDSSFASAAVTSVRKAVQRQHASPAASVSTRTTRNNAPCVSLVRLYQHGASTTYHANRTFAGTSYGDVQQQRRVNSHGNNSQVWVLNGFFGQYVTALSSSAFMSAVTQDYPRTLHVVDEVLDRIRTLEWVRRPSEKDLTPNFARAQRIMRAKRLAEVSQHDADDNFTVTDPPLAAQEARVSTSMMAAPVESSEHLECPHNGSDGRVSAAEALGGEIALVTPSQSNASANTHVVHVHVNPSTPSAPSNCSAAPSPGRRQPNAADRTLPANTANLCPVAPPAGGSLHPNCTLTLSEHFEFLVELETAWIELHVLRIVVLLLLNEAPHSYEGARHSICDMLEFSQLLRRHEAHSRTSLSQATETHPSNPPSAQHLQLAVALETLIEAAEDTDVLGSREGGVDSMYDTMYVDQMFGEVEHMLLIAGCRSRNLLVLLERAKKLLRS